MQDCVHQYHKHVPESEGLLHRGIRVHPQGEESKENINNFMHFWWFIGIRPGDILVAGLSVGRGFKIVPIVVWPEFYFIYFSGRIVVSVMLILFQIQN